MTSWWELRCDTSPELIPQSEGSLSQKWGPTPHSHPEMTGQLKSFSSETPTNVLKRLATPRPAFIMFMLARSPPQVMRSQALGPASDKKKYLGSRKSCGRQDAGRRQTQVTDSGLALGATSWDSKGSQREPKLSGKSRKDHHITKPSNNREC